MRIFSSFILASLICLCFSSCKKEKGGSLPQMPPVLSIKLNGNYVNKEMVDSAFVTWNINQTSLRIKLERRNDSLLLPLEIFEPGTGNLTVEIFTNFTYPNQQYGRWIREEMVELTHGEAILLNGPAGFFDQYWLPRVEVKDGIGHRAVVGLRPEDPYFIVSDPGHELYRLRVDRGYWKTIGGVSLAGRGIWECSSNCFGIPDTAYFTFLPTRIGNKPWNHISIVVLFEYNSDGQGWVISLDYDLPTPA